MPLEELQDKYECLAELGRGGMGVVYKARQLSLGRPVAIKMLARELAANKDLVRRFTEEARSIARMRNHPGIVEVYDFLQTNTNFYIVMEYVEGRSLAERLRDEGAFALGRGLALGIQVTRAIAHAHAAGVVHRDIKPENIMLLEDGRAKVMDFGIAHLGDTNLTQTGMVIGTPSYMSPEQAAGKSIDHRSDIYSLGVLFYQLAAGRVPFRAETPIALAVKHIQETPPPPREWNPELPEALEAAILRAMSKEPEQRFQSAGEMADTFQQLAENAENLQAGGGTVVLDNFQPTPVTPFSRGGDPDASTLLETKAAPPAEPERLAWYDWAIAALLFLFGLGAAWQIYLG